MRLKNIRKNYKLTQQQVADILHIKRGTYDMWELGYDTIPLRKLILFADYFNVSIDYLLELSDIKEYSDLKKFNKGIYLKRIKEVRKNKKMTQEKLATKLNTTNSVISRYEHGETFILTIYIAKYAKIFEVSIDYLLGRIDKNIEIKNLK